MVLFFIPKICATCSVASRKPLSTASFSSLWMVSGDGTDGVVSTCLIAFASSTKNCSGAPAGDSGVDGVLRPVLLAPPLMDASLSPF